MRLSDITSDKGEESFAKKVLQAGVEADIRRAGYVGDPDGITTASQFEALLDRPVASLSATFSDNIRELSTLIVTGEEE